MQQTLSSDLLGFALMNLLRGALSDSLGRRPGPTADAGGDLFEHVGWHAIFWLQAVPGVGIVVWLWVKPRLETGLANQVGAWRCR